MSTDHDAGGTLDGWDDELNDWGNDDAAETGNLIVDWADDDRVTDAELEAERVARNVCIRPGGECGQGYEHIGQCDWFDTTALRRALDQAADRR